MIGSQKVIDYLNFLIGGELAARDQYFIHSEMYAEWHYGKLYDRIHHEMEDETLHAQAIIRRILMLSGTPNTCEVDGVSAGQAGQVFPCKRQDFHVLDSFTCSRISSNDATSSAAGSPSNCRR